ncbi:MAG: DUF4392 domain-containing protein [Candidatus Bipolaricaulota bacterium]|nr:DUF4392 domain-containing protein [Candidatus Bipolaricaulota bacterium]
MEDWEGSLIGCAEAIDRLITVDVGSRGVIGKLYQAARLLSSKPLVLTAAEALQRALLNKDVVFIATGWPDRIAVDPTIAETDGPSGAAILARTLHRAFGVVPILLTEEQLVPSLREVVTSAGFKVLPVESALRGYHSKGSIHAATVLPFPISLPEAQREAKRLFELYSPGAVIVIEKGGMNESGAIYSCRGEETTETIAKADRLVIEARERGIFTLGIGDGGNEVGMGLIHDEAEEILVQGIGRSVPGGFAPSVPTDALVVAAVSNWGAYGAAACVAVLLRDQGIFHDENVERCVLEGCARAGFIDGVTGYVEGSVDGIPMDVHLALVKIMKSIVDQALRRSRS